MFGPMRVLQSAYFAYNNKTGERQGNDCRSRGIMPMMSLAIGTSGVFEDQRIETRPRDRMFTPILIENMFRPAITQVIETYCEAGLRVFAAGMDLWDRADTIVALLRRSGKLYMIDLSSWDGSLDTLTDVEARARLRFFGNHRVLKKLLKQQERKHIKGQGFKAKARGKRASGTAFTADANKTTMYGIIRSGFGCSEALMFCDGDDTILAPLIDGPEFEHRLNRVFEDLSMELKIEGVATRYNDVRFCRAGVVKLDKGFCLVKEPTSALKNALTEVRHLSASHFLPYLATKRVGMGILWNGVPILHVLNRIYPEGSYDATLLASSGLDYWMQTARDVGPSDITEEVRHDFHVTFGITPATQMRIEKLIIDLSPNAQRCFVEYVRRLGLEASKTPT